MRLIFLGTGGAWPTKKRNVSSTAVIFGDKVMLVDCGEGTQRQIHWCNFSFMKITHVLITHFHTDHFLGLFGLIESMYLNDRQAPLRIIGPNGMDNLVDNLRSIGLIKRNFPIEVYELGDGGELDIGGGKVRAFSNTHGPSSLGYVIDENIRRGKFNRARADELGIPEGPLFGKLQRGEEITVNGLTITPDEVMGPPRPGRKIVFSGDTHASDKLVEAAHDADVLVHEATFGNDNRERADEFAHSTAGMAAEAAKEGNVRCLVLNHISPRYDEDDALGEEAKAIFEKTIIANDLMELLVPYRDGGGEFTVVEREG